MQPLTHEQIWGEPAEQLPEPETEGRDYFDYLESTQTEVTDGETRQKEKGKRQNSQ
jgi:hypothetical protein